MNRVRFQARHCAAAVIVSMSMLATSVVHAQAAPAHADTGTNTPGATCKEKVANLDKLRVNKEKQIGLLRKELGMSEPRPPQPPPPAHHDDKGDNPGMHQPPPAPSCSSERSRLQALISNYDQQIKLLTRQVERSRTSADSDTPQG